MLELFNEIVFQIDSTDEVIHSIRYDLRKEKIL